MKSKSAKYLSVVLVFLIFVYLFVNTNYLDFLKIELDYNAISLKEHYNKQKKEIAILEPKADMGDKDAQLRIGSLCLEDVHLDYDKAFKYLKMSAEHGDNNSQLLLGDMYHHGWGIAKNNSEALKWYSKSAEQDNIIARDNLIALYLEGDGVEKDYQKAIYSLQHLADKEDMFVEYLLFFLYKPILGIEPDYERSFKWFSNPPKNSYYQNYDLFRYCLAYMYENGLGTDKDLEKAKYWYDKIGNENTIKRFKDMQKKPLEDIQHTLGIIYYYTYFYRFSTMICSYGSYGYKKAFAYYTESAETGNSDSYFLLYNRYYYKDKTKALNYLIRAAELGNITAMRRLGYMYFYGDKKVEVKKDYKKACKWYSKASEFGDIISTSQLSFLYYYGKGIKKDYKKAFEFFSKIVKYEIDDKSVLEAIGLEEYELWQFKTISEFMMAYMYEHGLGVDKNIYKAIELYIKLSEEDFKLAQYRLGYIYEHGNGVKKDKREAGYWYSKIGTGEDIKKCKEFINNL